MNMTIRNISILLVMMLLSGSTGTSAAWAAERIYTLEEAYQSAFGSNEAMKIAEESRMQSDLRVDQAWTYLYPRVVARGAYTKYDKTLPPSGGPFLFQPDEQLFGAVVLTQPLYTGGRTLAALRSAQTMQETSAADLSNTKQNLMINVAEVYYAVIKAQKAVEINMHSLKRMEEHRAVTEREARARRTKANQSALLRANSLVSQAKISLVRSEDFLAIARNRLKLVSGLPQDARVGEPRHPAAPAGSLEEHQKTALESRDDYANSRMDKKIAEENVTIVKGGHYPQLYGEAGVQYASSHPEMVTDATVYYAGLRLQVPIFEGGLMKAEVSEAKSKVRQAELKSDYLKKSIETDVQEAYINLRTVESVLTTAQAQREYAQGNYDAVVSLFSEGLLPSLSLIDAEQALTLAEQELMNVTYERDLAILRLERAEGTLLKRK